MVALAGFATKGLEDILGHELGETFCGLSVACRTKLVQFELPELNPVVGQSLSDLKTADDLCVVTGWGGDIHTVTDMEALFAAGHWSEALTVIRDFRVTARDTRNFSVTVTAARTQLGNSAKLAEMVESFMVRATGLQPSPPRTRAPIDVRLFVDQGFVLTGIRLLDHPLSKRSYRLATYQGALSPTVAAAMVAMAGMARGGNPLTRLGDPCCGSGTILAEAYRQAVRFIAGSDSNPEAIKAARSNVRALNPRWTIPVEKADLTCADTWKSPWLSQADAVVTNVPWGKQVPTAGRGFFGILAHHLVERVHEGAVGCVLTTHPDQLQAQIVKRAPQIALDTRELGFLGQTPTVVLVGGSTALPAAVQTAG